MKKKRILIVCPGRGSYTAESLNYLQSSPTHFQPFIENIDQLRRNLGEMTISELDQKAKFQRRIHTRGDHASPLIYACSAMDFASIPQDTYEIVAITGNSMGWYLALAFSKALNETNAFQLIQTMGGMTKDTPVGGQIIYPVLSEDWQPDNSLYNSVCQTLEEINQDPNHFASISIELGGYLVIGGQQNTLDKLMEQLPSQNEGYPFQLFNHSAFHTPLLKEISQLAFQKLPLDLFSSPKIPIIDGRGKVWGPYSTSPKELRDYTLDTQVLKTYSFNKSIEVGLKEFAPDQVVLLGPGNQLGGPIGQIFIEHHWHKIKNKKDFTSMQKSNPLLVSMAIPEQKNQFLTRSPENGR